MTGYRVGAIHPTAQRRQFHELTVGEVADLAEGLVYSLRIGLRIRDVAGAEQVGEWALAQRVRDAVLEHHQQAKVRAMLPQLGGLRDRV